MKWPTLRNCVLRHGCIRKFLSGNRRKTNSRTGPKIAEAFGQPSQLDGVTSIADHVTTAYDQIKAAQFLDGADPWIIAHAICDKGIVVSQESRVDINSQTPKIPNVCSHFGVQCIDVFEMLKQLGFSFGNTKSKGRGQKS